MNSEGTWPAEFADFKRLDAVLKCGICYDYMTNCMITSCSHTYCSLCIRKFMQYKNQCPACFEETYEVHLRNNRPLDEVIAVFVQMKDKLQRALRLATINIPLKEPKSETKDDPRLPPKTPRPKGGFEPKTPSLLRGNVAEVAVQLFKDDGNSITAATPARSSIPKEKQLKTPNTSQSSDKLGDDVLVNGVKIPGIFNTPIVFPKPRKPEEMAQCPVCQVEVPAKNINIHLDSCLAAESDIYKKKAKVPKKRDPLPKRLYHLMQDKALKKILKDYGLNQQGDRKVLISRIQRYTVIYNAENDSPCPRPVSELIAQLEREEREEKKPKTLFKSTKQQQQRVTVDRKADPKVIEEANKAYRDENKQSFDKLIEQMRAREGKNIKPTKPAPRVYSDDEDSYQFTNFNPDIPSTSKADPLSETSNAIYNETTHPAYESDSDLFEGDDQTSPQKGLVDWNKTKLSDEEEEVCEIIDSDDEETKRESEDVRKLHEEVTPEKTTEHLCKTPAVHKESIQSSVTPECCEDPMTTNKCNILDDSNKPKVVDSNPNPCLNDSSEKENCDSHLSEIEESSNTSEVSKPKLKSRDDSNHSDSSMDSIDAMFTPNKAKVTTNISPRKTRSHSKSFRNSLSGTPNSAGTKSQSNTPTPTRGTKRKSREHLKSLAPNNLESTLDYLFEKYNGDRVDENIDSDDSEESTSVAKEPETEHTNEGRQTRMSTRNRDGPTDGVKVVTRKRAKRDQSPAF